VNKASYDECAELYDAAFTDIKVRELEWKFIAENLAQITDQLGRLPKVLEIGCGNGQLLRQLIDEGLITEGIGADISTGMLTQAQARNENTPGLRFLKIDGPNIDLPDQAVDVVISFLSFRYLDWPSISHQIERLGNAFLMVDMATTEFSEEERPLYDETKKRTARLHAARPDFAQALQNLCNWNQQAL
jgi:SAM-dependent methyltransferase